MLLIAISGALAGFLHVLSGPDHLTAVAPLAASDGRRGWLAGWTWGIGHSAGVLLVAMAAILLRLQLPPIEIVSAWSERVVGVALIGVGLWALRRSNTLGAARHTHGHEEHEHLHVTKGPAWLRRLGHAHASLYLGVLHGVAGSSHFLGVLPALALPSTAASAAYITGFGVGTVGAMTVFAAGVGYVSIGLGRRVWPQRALMLTSSLAALVVGSYWLLA